MHRLTLLIVDDERAILDLLREVLEAEGYTVVTATDGLSALELVHAVQPALILTDIMLPQLDGLTLCARLQADPQTAHLPVLLMSAGRTLPAEGSYAEFLSKPFHLDDLLAVLARCLPRPRS